MTEFLLIDVPHALDTPENSLHTFIAERHLNDTYQLTNFDDVSS
jgi:hypothetical protein